MPTTAALTVLTLIGMALCVVSLLSALRLRRLRALQVEAVRQAAAEARERLGRDVHDLLGSRLWLASLRSELAYRLADEDSPMRPALAEVIESIRQAATDIRNVTRSYEKLSLWSELADARAVLSAYGTDCVIEAVEVDLPPEVSAVLAVTVREAVTNLLRHSRARRCMIEVTGTKASEARAGSGIRLSIANDGVGPVASSSDGNGIANLRIRATELGGTVRTLIDPDGWFRLITEIPNPAPR